MGGHGESPDEQQPNVSTARPTYLFKWLCVAQVFVYLEAGAVPALLVELSDSFAMDFVTQGTPASPRHLLISCVLLVASGILGGIVFLALSSACPVAGILFRKYDSKMVLGIAMTLNNVFMVFFALTPLHVAGTNSKWVLIGWRAAVGFTQAFLSIYGTK
jgi:MFS family permease